MTNRTLKAQTPGAPPVSPASNAPAPNADASNTAASVPTPTVLAQVGQVAPAPILSAEENAGAPKAETETVSIPKSQLEELMSRINALESRAAPARLANPETELPDQSQVDPNKITTTVLTKQGWVVPVGYGDNPSLRKF